MRCAERSRSVMLSRCDDEMIMNKRNEILELIFEFAMQIISYCETLEEMKKNKIVLNEKNLIKI